MTSAHWSAVGRNLIKPSLYRRPILYIYIHRMLSKKGRRVWWWCKKYSVIFVCDCFLWNLYFHLFTHVCCLNSQAQKIQLRYPIPSSDRERQEVFPSQFQLLYTYKMHNHILFQVCVIKVAVIKVPVYQTNTGTPLFLPVKCAQAWTPWQQLL